MKLILTYALVLTLQFHQEMEWNCSRKKFVYQRADQEVISFATLWKNIDELKVGFLLKAIGTSLCHSFVIS
jgi:hypothetical protein